MGTVGTPAGVINESFNPAAFVAGSENTFQVRSWDYDPATFTITIHTNRNNVNFDTAGGLPNPSMTIQFVRRGTTVTTGAFFSMLLTLNAGAQADGSDDLTGVVTAAQRNAFNAAGGDVSISWNPPGRLLSNPPVGATQTITTLNNSALEDTGLLVNEYIGDGTGAHYRSVGRRNIDWLFTNETPANFNRDPTDAVIDLDDLIAQVEGIEGAPGAAGTNAGVINLWQVTTTMDPNGDGTPIAGPTGTFVYNFETRVLDGGNLGDWSTDIPTVPQGSFLWITTATASAAQLIDLVDSAEFSSPPPNTPNLSLIHI